MENIGARGRKQWPAFLERTLITTDHVAEGLCIRASFTAADFSIDHSYTFRRCQGSDVAHCPRMNGAVNGNDGSGFSGGEYATLFKGDCFHLRIVDDDQ